MGVFNGHLFRIICLRDYNGVWQESQIYVDADTAINFAFVGAASCRPQICIANKDSGLIKSAGGRMPPLQKAP